jgi:DNA-binding CsgD family transcriptional regulator
MAARLALEELQRAGGRAPARGNGAEQLTPSERRVAELAGQGRTSRAIATEPFVTVKAVEWHLGNVYRKLGVPVAAALPLRLRSALRSDRYLTTAESPRHPCL